MSAVLVRMPDGGVFLLLLIDTSTMQYLRVVLPLISCLTWAKLRFVLFCYLSLPSSVIISTSL